MLEDSFIRHHAEAKTHEIYLASSEQQTVTWLSLARLPRSPAGSRG